MKKKKIVLPMWLWFKLMFGLKKRGQGCRESGGFLLGEPGKLKVSRIVYYDQFDKKVSDSGIIQFTGAVAFYEYLTKTGLRVLADIHTHPTSNTSQSDSDRTHPMNRIKGHIAIIAPHFAVNPMMLPVHCSVYEYLGNYQWRKYQKRNLPFRLKMI